MRAVGVFPGKKEVRIVDHPEPRVTAPGQVKLRMLDVGVCGTDREIVSFEYGTPPPGFDYFVLGHESLGEVVEVGPQVDGMKPGDLVVSTVRRPCPNEWCTPCRAGSQDFCLSGDYHERGIKDLHGFMTELVIEQRRYLHAVPRELRDVAVLVEPLTIAEKAWLEIARIQTRLPWDGYRHTAVVLGAGPVGLLGAMLLVNAGCHTYVYSRSPKPNAKAAVAEAVGAQYVSSEDVPVEKFAAMAGRLDVVYEAMGAPQTAFEVLKYLGANGVFVFTGIPGRQEPVRFDESAIMRNLVLKNQVVMGTVNASEEAFANAIRDLGVFTARWPAAVRSIITGRFRMEDFRDPILGKSGGIKSVIAIASG